MWPAVFVFQLIELVCLGMAVGFVPTIQIGTV